MKKAENFGIKVVYNVLNRYENHQIVTSQEALKLINDVESSYLLVLLDAYHMNIEEASSPMAIKQAGGLLGLYHVADSNREAVGNGQANIKPQIDMLNNINYKGPIIMELMAPGPNPFIPINNNDSLKTIVNQYKQTLKLLQSWK